MYIKDEAFISEIKQIVFKASRSNKFQTVFV